MTDIRSRLEAALREHRYEWRDHGWHCLKCDVPPCDVPRDEECDDWSSDHVISVLLSLPGIAIVELPEPLPGGTADEKPKWEIADIVIRPDNHDWVRLNSQALEPWERERQRRQQVDDLVKRLAKADAELQEMTRGRTSELGFDVLRLKGKAEGVRLALSYVQEYLR